MNAFTPEWFSELVSFIYTLFGWAFAALIVWLIFESWRSSKQ